jgi:hypothetical protein
VDFWPFNALPNKGYQLWGFRMTEIKPDSFTGYEKQPGGKMVFREKI